MTINESFNAVLDVKFLMPSWFSLLFLNDIFIAAIWFHCFLLQRFVRKRENIFFFSFLLSLFPIQSSENRKQSENENVL